MNKGIVIMGLVLLLSGCSDSLFNQIATNDIIPGDARKPAVKSFDKQDSIVVTWEKDPGSDEYILYRATGSPTTGYSEVYRGSDCAYLDNVGQYDEGDFMYYKVAKKRESVEFKQSGYTIGPVSKHIKDECEDNDTWDSAYVIDNLQNPLNLNIYYCRDSLGNEAVDTDYFSVEIPAGTYYTFHLAINNGNINNSPLIVNNFYGDDKSFTDSTNINVYNNSSSKSYKKFYVRVDKSLFLGNPNSTGFKMLTYIINFVDSHAINPQG